MKVIWWLFFWVCVGVLLMADLPWWGELLATVATLGGLVFVIVHWTVRKPLEASIAAVRTELGNEIKLVRTELGSEIRSVRTELGGQIELLREGKLSQGEQLVSLTKRVDDLWRVVADEGNGVIPRLVRLETTSEHIRVRPCQAGSENGASVNPDTPLMLPIVTLSSAFAERVLPRAAASGCRRHSSSGSGSEIAFDGNRSVRTGATAPTFSHLRGTETENKDLLDQTSGSWNQIITWLQDIAELPQAS